MSYICSRNKKNKVYPMYNIYKSIHEILILMSEHIDIQYEKDKINNLIYKTKKKFLHYQKMK